jgi:hypothetical protein
MVWFLNFVKNISYTVTKWFLISSLILLAGYSSMVDTDLRTTNNTIQQDVSDFYSTSHKKAIKKSRNSAVRLISIDIFNGSVSTFSGTYVKSYGSYFVVTVAHGMVGSCDSTKVVYEQELYDCIKVIDINIENDYAIIQVEEISEREAVDIERDLPRRKQWNNVYSLLNKVVYTGYPNSIGPLSIDGSIAGASGNRFIYLYSYAWEGSSGSGVFDHRGKYIGHIVAIDVGSTDLGVQVLNNVVLVVPSFKIDWTKTITEAE